MNREARRDVRRYVVGTLLSAALTALAFFSVMSDTFDRTSALWIVGAAAVAQIVVQLRCFLHVGWRQKREDLLLILFSLLLMAMMIGGTIWIMASLQARMH